MSMTVEVRVPNLDCEGCASKLKRALFKLKGVEEVVVDMEIQKLTARGYRLEEKKVLKAVRRVGKVAEPWSPTSRRSTTTHPTSSATTTKPIGQAAPTSF